MNGSGPLSFEATINDTNWQSRLDAMERRLQGLTTTTIREANKVDSTLQNLGRLAVGAFALNGISDLPGQILKVRGEFEQLEIAFTTMLRSKEKANAFLREGVEFASTTPFSLKDVGTAQKQLLAYGFSVEEVIPAIKRLGDVSAGLGLPLERLTYLYGTTKTQGRLFAQDLNQFVGSGIPLIAELAKQFGVTDDRVRKLVEEGKVGFPEVKKALESLTSGSGIFAGTLEAQSKSVLGLKEKLGDAYDAMLNKIGKDNQELIAGSLTAATAFVENYEPILDTLKVLIATYGAYRAALVATAVVQGAVNVAGNVQAWLSLATTIRSAKDAQIAFNLATSANPYAIAAAAIVAITTALVLYKRELTSAQQLEQDVSEARSKARGDADVEVAKIERLKRSITSEKLSRDERNKALKDLIAIAPDHLKALTLENIKTDEGTAAINGYITARRKQIETEQIALKLDESIKRQLAVQRGEGVELGLFDQLKLAAAAAGGEGSFDYDKAKTQTLKEQHAQIIKTEQARQAGLQKELEGISTSTKASVAGEGVKQKARAATIEQIDAEIKAQKESLSLNNSDAKNASIRREIDKLEAQKRKLTGELSATEKKAAKEAAKSGPFGSIDYYETVAKKAGEILEKLAPKDADKIAQQAKIKFDAEQKAEELRKQYAIKSFDEELSDKRSKYELYTKWVEAYGRDAADNQFADLKKSGQSFLEYLNAQIALLEAKKTTGKPLSDTDTQNLGNLIGQRDAITGKKTAIDLFNESLQNAQVEAKNLSDYLTILKQKQEELNQTPARTADDFKMREEVAREILQTQQQLRLQLEQYLADVAGSEQQQTAIRTKYNELRASLDKKYLNNRGAEYKAALAVINSDEEKAIEEFQKHQLEQSDAYKATTRVILEEGEKRAQIEIDRQRAVVAEAKRIGGVTSELYRNELKKLNDLIDKNGGTPGQKLIATYSQVFGAFGQSLSSLGGEAAKAGEILSSLAGSLNLIGQALDKNTTKNQQYAIAIQGIVQLFGSIASAAAARKKAESDYYTSLIAQQQQYNLLLNQQLGIQAKSRENIFVKDYVGELQDGFKQFDDAQQKYQQSLQKLSEGRAKAGLKNYFDSSNFLSSVGAGAAAGAAIGTIVPVIGNAVGAVAGAIVGGIAGLFSSNKKVDEFGSLLALYPDLVKKTANGVDELNTALAESLIQQGLVDDQTKVLLQSTIDWQKQIEAAREAIKSIVSELAGNLGNTLRDNLVGAFKDGTDAAQVFSDSVSNILEDLVTKMLFSQAFNKEFQKLQDDLTASLDTSNGGDGNTIDDFQRFTDNSKEALAQYNTWLQQFQDAAAASGFSVLKSNKNTGTKNPNSISGVIQSQITEATANVLTGQINAIRITTTDTNALIRQQLLSLSGIEKNTGKTADNTAYLESIDRRLKQISESSGRGLGQPL